MFEFLYFIWVLLPLFLFWQLCFSTTKTVANAGTREYPKSHLKQFIYSVIMLVVAIVIDRTLYETLRPTLDSYGLEPRIFRWLIYPAMLTAGAAAQQWFIDKKVEEDNAEKKARRMKYAPTKF
jgi:hypothetical protein